MVNKLSAQTTVGTISEARKFRAVSALFAQQVPRTKSEDAVVNPPHEAQHGSTSIFMSGQEFDRIDVCDRLSADADRAQFGIRTSIRTSDESHRIIR